MITDKVVILARGIGSRMRRSDETAQLDPKQAAVADTGLKAMIPVGRPFLDYVLSGLADAGFREVCLVIGPEHDSVREYYTRVAPPTRLAVSFAVQVEARGTADALLSARRFTGDENFVVLNSDNLYPLDVLLTLRELGESGAVMFHEDSLIRNSNIPHERVRAFAYATLDDCGYLTDLVEKPDEATAATLRDCALVSMNCWNFSPQIFEMCRTVPLSPRGEYELPWAVRLGIKSGMMFKIVASTSGVLDLSTRRDIAAIAKRLRDIVVNV